MSPTTCVIEDCEKPKYHRDTYCAMHRRRIDRHGDPHYVTPRVRIDPVERFWSKVDIGAPGECWPYQGTQNGRGYGQFTTGRGSRHLAHRYAYEVTNGPIPEGLTIDHVKARGCVRTDCVNPGHLEAVTMRENLRRSNAASTLNSQKTTCPQGHEYDREKKKRRNGWRQRFCSICENEAARLRMAAKKRRTQPPAATGDTNA